MFFKLGCTDVHTFFGAVYLYTGQKKMLENRMSRALESSAAAPPPPPTPIMCSDDNASPTISKFAADRGEKHSQPLKFENSDKGSNADRLFTCCPQVFLRSRIFKHEVEVEVVARTEGHVEPKT